MNDPRFLEYIRHGEYVGGDFIGERRLRNMALLRCVTLISEAIGMLPINLLSTDKTKAVQSADPGHRLVNLKPNTWQTPYEAKAQITLHALLDGNGYGRIVRSPIGNRPVALVPLNRYSTMPRMKPGYDLVYEHVTPWGESMELKPQDVLHLRDVTLDGIHGLSRLRLGRHALDLAENTENSTARLFRSGVMAGGAIEVPQALSDNAYARMKESIKEDHSGADNAGSMMILEEGAKASMFSSTAQSSQQLENRNHQIEEVARMYGVPRPLLMMDDTSWGSGIEQLALFFIQFGLAHWFKCWEEALARCLISDARLGLVGYKFDESALLRGTLNDQASFFSKALGAGGSSPFLTPNEVREFLDMPYSTDAVADLLRNPMTQQKPGAGGVNNEPAANDPANDNQPKRAKQ
jgi:HK97 family phage portal protein